MDKHKKRVVTFILVFVVFLICFFYRGNTKEINSAPLNNIYFFIDGMVRGEAEFAIFFDKESKVIKIDDRKDTNPLNSNFEDDEVFNMEIYDSNGFMKTSVALLGGERGTSLNLNPLNDFPFEYGDIFKLYHIQPDKIRMRGDIDGFKPFDLRYEAIKFTITEKGITATYTDAPVFRGAKDSTVERGSVFDPLRGVKATSSLDGDLTSKIKIEGTVDTKKMGQYTLKYIISDRFNTIVEATRVVTVRDYKKTQIVGDTPFFGVYGLDDEAPEFKITFDKNKKVIRVVDRRDVNNLSDAWGDAEYFKVSLYDQNGVEKISANLLGHEKGTSIKLKAMDRFPFEYGDYLKFEIKDKNKIKLGGNLIGLREKYLRLDELKFKLIATGIEVEDTKNIIAANFQFKDNLVINKGEAFDPLKDILVTNEYNEDYLSKVQVEGIVDTSKVGEYTINYTIVDGSKRSTTFSRKIIVANKFTEEEIKNLKNLQGIYEDLKINNHKFYFRSIDREINRFIIKF